MDFAVLNRLNSAAVAYWTAIVIGAGALTLVWLKRGPDRPSYALVLAGWTFLLGPGVAIPVTQRIPLTWFRVPARERTLHRLLGVGLFGWLLERSGYNRNCVHPMWSFQTNRAGLRFRAQAARGGACAHGACFLIHLVLAAAAVFTGHPWGALWILLPGLAIHLYPVLLQRAILLRLQPLMAKYGSGI